MIKKLVKNKAVSIQNGIRKDIFVNTNNIQRKDIDSVIAVVI